MVIRSVIRRSIAAVALVLATLASAGVTESVAGAAEPARCSLGSKRFAHSVKALYSHEDSGYTAFRQFRGAEVFVPAQPGLTAEWLDLVLTSQLASGECNFGAPEVNVEVLSDGGGFSVRLSSNDERGAAEILRHAQQMVK
jgi:hypothetical protein